MTITQSRLIELQNLYNSARPDGTTPAFLWTECKEVINELVASRDAIARLREERVRLQDENEQLRSDVRASEQAINAHVDAAADEDEQERRLDALEKLAAKIDRDVDNLARQHGVLGDRLDARIDKVVEIIGDRTARLVEAIDETGLRAGLGGMDEVAFPTGGASTAEAAAEAVPTVPQRGDRVRLEGAESTIGIRIKDGWYDVVGGHDQSFQIRHPSTPGAVLRALSWVTHDDPGLKEVRPGAAEDVEK